MEGKGWLHSRELEQEEAVVFGLRDDCKPAFYEELIRRWQK